MILSPVNITKLLYSVNIRNQMKMQLRKILKLPAIDNESVSGEFEFLHETLRGGNQVGEEGSVRGIKFGQRRDRLLRHDQHVEWIGLLRVTKRHQCIRLTQAFNRNRKTHVGKHPSNDPSRQI